MNNIVVYTKENCPYCEKVKKVFEMLKWDYVSYTLGKDFTKEQFQNEFGIGSTFPQVIIEDNHVGGCSETVKYLKENGHV